MKPVAEVTKVWDGCDNPTTITPEGDSWGLSVGTQLYTKPAIDEARDKLDKIVDVYFNDSRPKDFYNLMAEARKFLRESKPIERKVIDHDIVGNPIYDPVDTMIRSAVLPIPGINV